MELGLLDLKRKEKGRIVRLSGGRGFQTNVETMGIREGKVVEMLTRHPAGGPVVIRIDNLTITLGRGMAMKVMVERI